MRDGGASLEVILKKLFRVSYLIEPCIVHTVTAVQS